jgi:CDGSH-type Zn-finger protein
MSSEPIKITFIPNGPARIQSGRYELQMSDGSTVVKEAPFSLCRCGGSSNKPFCDGSHQKLGFKG